MKAIISRTYNNNETLGTLMIMEGERPIFNCKTIELPDLGNQQNVSCIPEGKYDVIRHNSPTKGEVFWVLDVPGRSNILFHIGNFVSGLGKRDSKGCILPGKYFVDINNDGLIDIAESSVMMRKLLETLPDKFELHII